MRSEWVPISAAALITGVMALVLGQMLNPAGSQHGPADQMLIAAENPGRWLAMSVLFFGGAATLILGLPSVLTLFQGVRGRIIGLLGVAVFAVGCVGVGALASLMLMFRALALESIKADTLPTPEVNLVTASLENQGLAIMLGVWVYGFLLGVLLIAVGLFRCGKVPVWVPGLLIAFLVIQAVTPVLGAGTPARVASSVGLILLAAGFTGIATNAAAYESTVPVTHSLA